MAVSSILAIAIIAFLCPLRFFKERYRFLISLCLLLLQTVSAHCTSKGLIYAPALLILVVFFFPALSLFCGVRPAQEQRCFEDGNTDISAPISESTPIAAKERIPGTVEMRLICGIYFSATERIKDSVFRRQSSRLSM